MEDIRKSIEEINKKIDSIMKSIEILNRVFCTGHELIEAMRQMIILHSEIITKTLISNEAPDMSSDAENY